MGRGKRNFVYAKSGCYNGTAQDRPPKSADRQADMFALRESHITERMQSVKTAKRCPNGFAPARSKMALTVVRHAIYENEIKPIIEDIFKSGQQNIEELSACVLKLVSELLDANDNQAEINRLNKELVTQQKMKAKLLKFNTEGNMSDSEFLRMTAECDEEIVKLQMQIDTITQIHQNRTGDEKELDNIKKQYSKQPKSILTMRGDRQSLCGQVYQRNYRLFRRKM